MDPAPPPSHETDPDGLGLVLVIASGLWLLAAVAFRLLESSDDGWVGAYMAFSVVLLAAAAVASLGVTLHTSPPGTPSGPRIAAIAWVVVATASTIVAWAFVLWAVLLALGFAALAASGRPQRRHAAWLSAALLVGVVAAVVAAVAEIGDPGTYGDHSEAQGWGTTLSCVLTGIGCAALARRTHATHRTGPPVPAR